MGVPARRTWKYGITASVVQTQAGGTPLTMEWNKILTANASDAVTMPLAIEGMEVFIVNWSANTIQIFPALGDRLNANALNLPETLATLTTVNYKCMDRIFWHS